MPTKKEDRTLQQRILRQEQLLDAAYEVLVEKGTAAATVSDITDRASVSKGTFYLYFESKDHVVAALWARFVERFSERTKELVSLAPNIGWWGVADRLVADLIDYDLENKEIHRILASAARAEAIHKFLEADRKIIEFVADTIKQGAAAGDFVVSDPDITAEFLYHGTDQILLNSALSNQEVDRGRLVAVVTELVHKALGPGTEVTG